MDNIEKRLNDLEIKFSYQDELMNELNIIVASQQSKIDEMKIIIKSLSENSGGGEGSQNSSLKNERPPHY